MDIDNHMTITEAAYRWNIQDNTLKKRIKPSTRNESAIQAYFDKGLLKYFKKPGAIRGEWIITRQLMEAWYGNEVKRIPIDEWEKTYYDHLILEEESLDTWVCGINTAHSQHAWYGLDSIFIVKYVLESGETFYAVEHESVTELVKQTESNETIKDVLLHPTYEGSERTTEAVFTSEDAAFKYANDHFAQFDLEAKVEEYFPTLTEGQQIIAQAVRYYERKKIKNPDYTPQDALVYALEELDTGYDLTENEYLFLQAECEKACEQVTDKP